MSPLSRYILSLPSAVPSGLHLNVRQPRRRRLPIHIMLCVCCATSLLPLHLSAQLPRWAFYLSPHLSITTAPASHTDRCIQALHLTQPSAYRLYALHNHLHCCAVYSSSVLLQLTTKALQFPSAHATATSSLPTSRLYTVHPPISETTCLAQFPSFVTPFFSIAGSSASTAVLLFTLHSG